jgi:hypothetical protein
MINCPKCDEQIADDSAHCGYCGHQLEQKKKKNTMFGMAALGGDELKKAVDEAKEAKKEQADSSGGSPSSKASSKASEKGGGLKLPKPGQGSNSTASESKGSKLPKPGQKGPGSTDLADDEDPEVAFAKTERLDLSDAQPPEELPDEGQLGDVSSEAKTAHLDEVSSPQHELNVSDGDGPRGSQGHTQPVNMAEDSSPDIPGGPTEPTLDKTAGTGPSGPGAKDSQSNQVQVSREGSMPAGSAPSPQQGGFGDKKMTASHPAHPKNKKQGQNKRQAQNQMQGQQGKSQDDGGSKKKLIIGIVIATMVLGGGCVAVAGYFLLDYLGIL